MSMIHRSFSTFASLVFGLILTSNFSFGQMTNTMAPTTPPPAASAPAPAVAPPPAPAADMTSAPRPATYTLQPGDTLESIGKQWGLTGRQLQRYNHLTNHQVRRLQIGAVIKIPPASK